MSDESIVMREYLSRLIRERLAEVLREDDKASKDKLVRAVTEVLNTFSKESGVDFGKLPKLIVLQGRHDRNSAIITCAEDWEVLKGTPEGDKWIGPDEN